MREKEGAFKRQTWSDPPLVQQVDVDEDNVNIVESIRRRSIIETVHSVRGQRRHLSLVLCSTQK